MISRRQLFGTLAGLGSLIAFPAAAKPAWGTYRNRRFGTTMQYPNCFRLERLHDGGAGVTFTDHNGASISIWGSHNAQKYDLASLEARVRRSCPASEQIMHDLRGPNWFVVYGMDGDKANYQRQLLSHRCEIINAFHIQYPRHLTPIYQPILARMSRTMRPGCGTDTTIDPYAT